MVAPRHRLLRNRPSFAVSKIVVSRPRTQFKRKNSISSSELTKHLQEDCAASTIPRSAVAHAPDITQKRTLCAVISF